MQITTIELEGIEYEIAWEDTSQDCGMQAQAVIDTEGIYDLDANKTLTWDEFVGTTKLDVEKLTWRVLEQHAHDLWVERH